ncbi:hypothetical protein OCI51_25695 (plasmid) [Lysinibacillus capsici]|uniref:hypothetical protein n=1 Tax=Lysinibacillus capsici TaxID=2115968 RepID=UPI0021D8387C|nr:hypothetical protein [Lysinibacillus capsici]UYB49959.1 hypothetical protein OCI51_25695 [Lysinibacillus capsici]
MDDITQQKHTKEEIQRYLKSTFTCIKAKLYTVSKDPTTRADNVSFARIYDMNKEEYEELFLSLTADNFSHSVQNWKPGFEHELLYVFRVDTMLLNVITSEYDDVTVYIKINLLETPKMYCTYISCHEADESKPFDYYQY